MPLSSRRLYVYWFFLLVPALAVGAAALILLRREQDRVAEQVAAASEARRAAVEARVQLIAENASLLVDEIQQGVLSTLKDLPSENLDAALDDFEKSNPLVELTFRCGFDGTVRRPRLSPSDTTAGGFTGKLAAYLSAQRPWAEAKPVLKNAAPPVAADNEMADHAFAQNRASVNVTQVQSAREEARTVSKLSSSYDKERAQELAAPASPGEQIAAKRRAASLTMPDRGGWVPWLLDGRLYVIGWSQPRSVGDIRGVVLELPALVSRLASVLPADVEAGERYAVLDQAGSEMHVASRLGAGPYRSDSDAGRWTIARGGSATRGNNERPRPTFRVAFSTALPGWEVVAWVGAADDSLGTKSWLLAATVLVAAMIFTIVGSGFLLLCRARRSAEDAAQKTSFVANVSHEFKTPLTTIRLYSELLEEGRVRDPVQGREYLRTIGRETQRLARLVNNVLDFSRLEQGRKKYAIERVNLVADLRRVLDAQALRLGELGLQLTQSCEAAEIVVETDRDAVEQIVLNLVDNACKYAADGNEIAVSMAGRTGGGAEIRVMDRGPGVPAAHRERVFEKFHRVDDTLTAEKSGAGLGLSIARQLARGLGGELRYEDRLGGGATFILELP